MEEAAADVVEEARELELKVEPEDETELLESHGGGLVAKLCPTLCDPMDCSLPGSSVPGIFQARILEWVSISSSRDLPDPGTEPASLSSPALGGGFFTTAPPGKPWLSIVQTLKTHSCLLLPGEGKSW